MYLKRTLRSLDENDLYNLLEQQKRIIPINLRGYFTQFIWYNKDVYFVLVNWKKSWYLEEKLRVTWGQNDQASKAELILLSIKNDIFLEELKGNLLGIGCVFGKYTTCPTWKCFLNPFEGQKRIILVDCTTLVIFSQLDLVNKKKGSYLEKKLSVKRTGQAELILFLNRNWYVIGQFPSRGRLID